MEDRLSTNPFEIINSRLKAIESKLSDLGAAISNGRAPVKKYYSVSEAAEKLGVAKITLYRNIQVGKIPSKKIGTRVMIPGSFVEK